MFHTGITATYFDSRDSFLDALGVIAYLPLGMSYFGEAGFNFGIDVGPGVAMGDETVFVPYGNLKVGYRF